MIIDRNSYQNHLVHEVPNAMKYFLEWAILKWNYSFQEKAMRDHLAANANFNYLCDIEPVSPPEDQIYHQVIKANHSVLAAEKI